jgi:18S rRNA (guanine1575-N7)-methyltransferase
MTKRKQQNGGRERRPERASHDGPNIHYDINESARYTDTMESLQIQKQLTSYTIHLLGPSKLPIICDLGCGSGLSSTATGTLFIGLDISLPMLYLAQSKSSHALLACCDFGQGIPLRTCYFNAAISVSAVQWLCDRHQQQQDDDNNNNTATTPNSKIRTFMHSLHSILLPNTKAVLQVYVEDDNQAAQLINGALLAGFLAGFYVGFPHPNPAKKYFICLEKTTNNNNNNNNSNSKDNEQVFSAGEEMKSKHLTFNRSCPLAWPKTAPCSLSWLHHIHSHTDDEDDNVCTRLICEHLSLGRKYLRLYRRILGEREEEKEEEEEEGGGGGGEEEGREEDPMTCSDGNMFVYIEALATHRDLSPCGGAIVVHMSGHIPTPTEHNEEVDGLVVQRRVVAWGKRHIEDVIIKGGEVIKEKEMKVTAPCTDHLSKKIIMERRGGGGGGERRVLLNDHKNTATPPPPSNNNKFYSLEETKNSKVCILHAHRSTDMLVIKFGTTNSNSGEEEMVLLSRLVAEYGGCVVGVQANVYNDNDVDRTWFVYVPLGVDVSDLTSIL